MLFYSKRNAFTEIRGAVIFTISQKHRTLEPNFSGCSSTFKASRFPTGYLSALSVFSLHTKFLKMGIYFLICPQNRADIDYGCQRAAQYVPVSGTIANLQA
jgi:hypothetical protein